MALIRYGDMTKHGLVFLPTCLSAYAFSGMEYKKTSVGFIFLTIPRLGKRQCCIFELISVKAIPMFSGDHLMPKTPGSEVITFSWKQKLVGVSRTCGIIWKIMKFMKTEKFSKISKNNHYFTCLLLFRILVNLPNFEMLLHLNK